MANVHPGASFLKVLSDDYLAIQGWHSISGIVVSGFRCGAASYARISLMIMPGGRLSGIDLPPGIQYLSSWAVTPYLTVGTLFECFAGGFQGFAFAHFI